jgi:LuxR family transcriptional regulator, maltose regulon positive regulatory protein
MIFADVGLELRASDRAVYNSKLSRWPGALAAGRKDHRGIVVAQGADEHGTGHFPRFALAKFRPPPLPTTLVFRPGLQDRLRAGAERQLTVVVGSAGSGKSVLLSSWTADRASDVTAWLSCDAADASPVRFWAGFIEAPRRAAPGFGADAADLLAMDGAASADVTASIANDAAKLPAGSAVVVDDFHYAAPAAAALMTDLVERWPAGSAQLVLASRSDPALRLHRLRMAGQLCELREADLSFSPAESRALLAGFGVALNQDQVTLLHRHSEGWAAALQMAALSLRATRDPARVTQALQVSGPAIAEFFIGEVLDRQPAEITWFMLDTSVLGTLTAGACGAVTGRQDAAALLRAIDAASLFVVPLDEERTVFRYHHLVRQLLRAELRVRDPAREQALQLRAAEWFETGGDVRRAARHFLAARHADRALALLQDRVAAGFIRDPALPPPLDLSMIDPALAAEAPDRLLGLTLDLLTSGDTARGGEYVGLLERAWPAITPEPRLEARFAGVRAAHLMATGRAGETVREALTTRAIGERAQFRDDITAAVPMVLLRAYAWLEDYEAVDREAATARATPELAGPVQAVLVPGAQALAWCEAGHLAKAADAAEAAGAQARQLGFDQHFFAVDYLRALAGLALERRDLDAAEQLAEQALSISERGRPAFTFLALLDRAAIWAARGQVRDALATIEAARPVLAGTGSELLARADELEALLRLSLGDHTSSGELASGLPEVRRALLRARIALAARDHRAAQEHLRVPRLADLTPRLALVRQILLAAAAIERDDPMAAGLVGGVLDTARRGGFLHTAVTTAGQVTSYLVAHSTELRPHPFTQQLITAALDEHSRPSGAAPPGAALLNPLTPAEQRVLQLLPTSTYNQIAATLYVSRATVKTHLRSIYQKFGVTSRAQAIQRAIDLRIL